MKRITFYKAIKNPSKEGKFPNNVTFQECKGSYACITDITGMKVEFALEYNRKLRVFEATELSSGCSSGSVRDKNKLELLKKLSSLNLKQILSSDFSQQLIKMLEDFKNGKTQD